MNSKNKKVLILGLDGVRVDAWQEANTPNLDKLSKNGVYSTDAITEIDTVSGACWTSLLKGVHREKHGVVGNNFKKKNNKYETLFKIAKSYDPTIRCVANSHWKPIITKIFEDGVLDRKKSASDAKVVLRTIYDIEKNEGDLYFIQLDDCDAAGHKYTYNKDVPKYIEQIELTDSYIGQIMSAVNTRPKDEKWLVCVNSDHGGNGRSHGGPTYGELNIVFIISGNSIKNKGKIDYDEDKDEGGSLMPHIVDFVPTIAEFLGITKRDYWDGVSRAEF